MYGNISSHKVGENRFLFSEGIVNPDCYYELPQSFLWELLKTKNNKNKKVRIVNI